MEKILNKYIKMLLVFIFFIIHCTLLFAQSSPINPNQLESKMRPAYGLFFNINLNQHVPEFQKLPNIPCCSPIFNESSISLGFSAGILYDIALSKDLDLNLRLGIFNLGGKLKKDEHETFNLNGEAVDGIIQHTIQSSLLSFGLEPMIGYRIFDRFSLHLGLHGGFVFIKKYTQEENLIEPPIGTFENGARTRLKSEGDLPQASSLEFALIAGISYEIPLNNSKTIILAPEAYFQYGLTKIIPDIKWNVNAFRIGFSLKYSPAEEPPPPPVKKDQPKEKKIYADINASGLDFDGSEIPVVQLVVEEFYSTRIHPLLTYVFFDENSAIIPERYHKLNSQQAQSKEIKDFYHFNALDTYHEVLNIIGKRMNIYSDAKIILEGCNSNTGVEKGNIDLSKNRAEAVKNYLVNVWKIDSSRISIKYRNLPQEPTNPTAPDGIEENRRVEILSNKMEIIAPIIINDTLRITNPPSIRFKNIYGGYEKIGEWKIEAIQDNKILKVFSSRDSLPSIIDWKFSADEKSIPRSVSDLKYKLQVKDIENREFKTDLKSLPVKQITLSKKQLEMIGDKIIDRFSLILFSYDERKLSEYNMRIMDLVKSYIKPTSTVKVSGHTDRLGDENYNLRLSESRAKAVFDLINSEKKVLNAYGETDLIYDNNLPEGRFYDRRVDINIETPIEK